MADGGVDGMEGEVTDDWKTMSAVALAIGFIMAGSVTGCWIVEAKKAEVAAACVSSGGAWERGFGAWECRR